MCEFEMKLKEGTHFHIVFILRRKLLSGKQSNYATIWTDTLLNLAVLCWLMIQFNNMILNRRGSDWLPLITGFTGWNLRQQHHLLASSFNILGGFMYIASRLLELPAFNIFDKKIEIRVMGYFSGVFYACYWLG